VINIAGGTSEDKTPIRTRKGVGWPKGRNVTVEKPILNRIRYKAEQRNSRTGIGSRMAKGRTKGKEESPEMAREAPTTEKPS
jgi:hypothetical protein